MAVKFHTVIFLYVTVKSGTLLWTFHTDVMSPSSGQKWVKKWVLTWLFYIESFKGLQLQSSPYHGLQIFHSWFSCPWTAALLLRVHWDSISCSPFLAAIADSCLLWLIHPRLLMWVLNQPPHLLSAVLPWRWRLYAPPKLCYAPTRLHQRTTI